MRVSRTGLPATEQVLDNTRPLLRRVDPFLRQFTPIVDYLGLYKREIAALFANDTAVTQAADQGQSRSGSIHYLRTQNPENPEVMAGYPSRLATNRSNPYIAPGGYMKLKTEGHLETYGPQGCGTTASPRRRPRSTRGCPPAWSTRSATTRSAAHEPEQGAAVRPADAAGAAVRPGRSVPAASSRCP